MIKIPAISKLAAQCCAMRFTLAEYGYTVSDAGYRWHVYIYQE